MEIFRCIYLLMFISVIFSCCPVCHYGPNLETLVTVIIYYLFVSFGCRNYYRCWATCTRINIVDGTITPIFHVFSINLGEIKRSTSMSFVEGNLGTWPKEKRFVTGRLCRSFTLFGSSESCIIVML